MVDKNEGGVPFFSLGKALKGRTCEPSVAIRQVASDQGWSLKRGSTVSVVGDGLGDFVCCVHHPDMGTLSAVPHCVCVCV